MRNIHQRYVRETYDDQGLLETFSVECPPDFNFGYDVVDDIAENDPDRRAMVWCNPEGEEHVFTFGDMKEWSDRTANFLASCGIGRGDFVMVILRRHYQFWFVATALAKLGAVMVPATFMLKEHDLEYRLQGAGIKAVIATSCGDIADVVDNVAASCPTVQAKILVNGAGGGLTPRDGNGALAVAADAGPVGAALSGPDGVCAAPGERAGWKDFNAGVRAASADFARRETAAAEPMLMYFSSGTSGNPKMVLHDSAYALAHLVTAKHWHDVRPDGIHFTIADTGWGKAVWGKYYGQWLMEACVFTYDFDRFQPLGDTFAHRATTASRRCAARPTMYRLMMQEDVDAFDLSSLRVLHHGGRGAQPRFVRLLEGAHRADHLRGLWADRDAAHGGEPGGVHAAAPAPWASPCPCTTWRYSATTAAAATPARRARSASACDPAPGRHHDGVLPGRGKDRRGHATTAGTTRATRPGATRTATSGTWAATTTSSSRAATASGPSRSKACFWSTRRCASARSPACPTPCAARP